MRQVNVIHDKENEVFYADVEGQRAELNYKIPEDGVIDFKSTFVPESVRGNDIGKQLVTAALDYAHQNNFRVVPTCRFVEGFVHKQHR